MKQRITTLAILALIAVLLIGSPVLAYIYRAPYTVISENTTDFEMLGVYTDNAIANQWMADNGFFNSDARDTRIETLGGLDKPHMVADDKTFTAIPVPAGSQTNLYFTTGESEQDFYVIPGYGGYVTVADEASIELSANFTVEQSGWVDTSFSEGDAKLLVDKTGAFQTVVSATGNITSIIDGDAWVQVAAQLDGQTTIYALAVFNGKVYGGTRNDGRLYEWNGSNLWVEVAPQLDGETQINSLAVYNGKLYGGTFDDGRLYEWNGNNLWVEVAPKLGAETIIYALAVHNDKLYGGTGDNGKLYEWDGDDEWVEVAPQLDGETRILSLVSYNGKLYGGTFNDGRLYEWDGDDEWVQVAPKLGAETQINSLAVYNGKLYGGTGSLTGKLYEWDAVSVTATGVSSGEHTVTTNGTANYPAWATGNVLHFDGNAQIKFADPYDAVNDFWVSLWFKLDNNFSAADVTHQHLIGKFVDGANHLLVYLNYGSGKLTLQHYDAANTDTLTSSETSWNGGQWYHVLASCSTVNGMRLIIDGGTPITNPAHVTPFTLIVDMIIGNDIDGGIKGLVGVESNVIMGNDILVAPDEEAALYNGTAPADAVNYFYIDEGTGTTIVDYGTGADDGTADAQTSWAISTYTTGKTGRLCDFTIQVDDDRWGKNLKGITVTDTNPDWIFCQNDAMPYADSITIWIGGIKELWFQPNDIISGTTLPDRATSVANDGTFTFGANPDEVSVTMGGLVSSSQPSPGVTVEDPTPDIMPGVEVTDWYVEPDVGGTLLTNPMRPFVTIMSDTTNMTELQAWRLLGTALLLSVIVASAWSLRGHALITGVIACVAIIGLVALTIYPMWTLIFVAFVVVATIISERAHSL